MPSACLRRNVFQPCDGGPLLLAMYLATLVWPTSIPILSSSPWIRGAPHNGFAMLISRINWRSSSDTAGRPGRRLDFQRQYDRKPARCQRITVSGRMMASASQVFGHNPQTQPRTNLSLAENGNRPTLPRRSTMICCRSTRISASSVARDRKQIEDETEDQFDETQHPGQRDPILCATPTGFNLQAIRRRVCSTTRSGHLFLPAWP